MNPRDVAKRLLQLCADLLGATWAEDIAALVTELLNPPSATSVMQAELDAARAGADAAAAVKFGEQPTEPAPVEK